MRIVSGDVISKNNLRHPFTCLCSGSSGAGKTTFVEKLLLSNRISNLKNKKFSHIYYFHPDELDVAPVDWADTFESPVSYNSGIPDSNFYKSIKENSIIVFDDNFYDLTGDNEFVKAFRVYARKFNFSIIAISQSYFEGQKHSRTVRNNCDLHILFENWGGLGINLTAARRLGYETKFKEAAKEAYSKRFGYVMIFTGSDIQNDKLRVQTNFFSSTNNLCFY